MGRKDSIPDDAPAPRLCSLSKWEHFQGYGFNLHSEKGKEGQYIGKIDPASPAEACGLVEGDQIIEVNGVNTSNENHKQVVQRIKADPDKVDLLVVDSAAAEYYKKRGIVVKGSMANVKKLKNAKGSSDQDQETGESSCQGQPSVEDCLTFAANSNEDVPPPIPPKTDLSHEVAKDCTSEDHQENKQDDHAEKEKVPDVSKDAVEPEEAELPPPPPAEKAAETTDSSEEEKHEQESTGASTEEAVASSGSENGKSDVSQKSAERESESTKAESPRIDTTLQVDSGSDRAQPSPAPSAGSTGTVESAKSAGSAKSAESAKSGGETEDKFGLKLNMTAAEMKEYLKSKKREKLPLSKPREKRTLSPAGNKKARPISFLPVEVNGES